MSTPQALTNIKLRGKEMVLLESVLSDIKKHNVANFQKKRTALRKSIIVNLITMWETFIEDTITEATDFIANNCTEPTDVSYATLIEISNDLISRKDDREIWKIAGDGWKNILIGHTNELVGRFHTPRPDNIDILFLKSIGMKNLSKSWKWHGKTNNSIKKQLNVWVTRRGEIVHQILSKQPVHKKDYVDLLNVILRCSTITSNVTREHVKSVTGTYPWNQMKFYGTK